MENNKIEKKDNRFCVIMAGGIGSRFWPISRQKYPKQFIDVLGVGRSLLQLTYDRMSKLFKQENIYIVGSEIYREQILSQLNGINERNVLLEPQRKNTAPCVAFACSIIKQVCKDATLVVVPSDHVIQNEDRFGEIIYEATAAAEQEEVLITLGIKPDYPNTGYGYLQFLEHDSLRQHPNVKKVKLFAEKPNEEMAKQFLESGDFLWNAGIFIWTLTSVEKALEKYCHDVFLPFKDVVIDPQNEESINNIYSSCPSISIDYAIMERATNVYTIVSDFGWSDVGTWKALYDVLDKDEKQNAVINKNVLAYDSQNCIINVPNDKVVVLEGLNDYIVVESDNVLLVCRKGNEQRIKEFVVDVNIEKGSQYI
ncbi:MAG: mannose-1-phosphate guanylyltransferase [Bacteroidales bacterium]|jgi:mannose-1-phosphate guanylyltransferase|nr:mannose-1-phosphate guanylyltransferase [Bacteroidales bacterium]